MHDGSDVATEMVGAGRPGVTLHLGVHCELAWNIPFFCSGCRELEVLFLAIFQFNIGNSAQSRHPALPIAMSLRRHARTLRRADDHVWRA